MTSPPWPPDLSRFAVLGHSSSGKTTLLRQLVAALTARGLRVGSVKHASHPLALDVEGKDSWRHAAAGASRVLLVGPGMAVGFVHREAPPELDAWADFFGGHVDVVLVEGYKNTPMPRVWIEVGAVDAPTLTPEPAAEGPAWRLVRPDGPLDPERGFPAPVVTALADIVAALARPARAG